MFDFLELGEQERALIARIEDFLRAMGGMFAFMGSQYRLEVEGKEFFIDLLLFHRRLRALVANCPIAGRYVTERRCDKVKASFVRLPSCYEDDATIKPPQQCPAPAAATQYPKRGRQTACLCVPLHPCRPATGAVPCVTPVSVGQHCL